MILKARRTPRNEAGLTKKQQEKADRKLKIQELKSQGYKQKDVIKLLGLSERTVRADWK